MDYSFFYVETKAFWPLVSFCQQLSHSKPFKTRPRFSFPARIQPSQCSFPDLLSLTRDLEGWCHVEHNFLSPKPEWNILISEVFKTLCVQVVSLKSGSNYLAIFDRGKCIREINGMTDFFTQAGSPFHFELEYQKIWEGEKAPIDPLAFSRISGNVPDWVIYDTFFYYLTELGIDVDYTYHRSDHLTLQHNPAQGYATSYSMT